jgi:DNA-binding CsgD family transcriptional regulator
VIAAPQWPRLANDGAVPEPAAAPAERKRLAYEAARRRSAVTLLRIMACTCDYASERLSNGADPAEAAATMEFVTGELAEVAAALRRLERLSPAQRRVRAAQLTALGMSREEVGRRLGVSAKTIRNYLRTAAPEMAGQSPWR